MDDTGALGLPQGLLNTEAERCVTRGRLRLRPVTLHETGWEARRFGRQL